jgi:ribonuclease J
MRLRIHHGAAQIGGNAIELQAQGQSLLLDLGLSLESAPVMPDVPGLLEPDPALLGVVLSHPHLDHYGLLPSARPDLPVWLGDGAKRLLEAARPFTAGAVLPQAVSTYRDREPFEVGPFRLTPYLMDHSAFDAHALLIEAEGQRVFYSGDFRGHGRKAKVFERFLADPPKDIDVLLMEGTTITRDEPAKTEADVEAEAGELMRAHQGLMLLCFSGQNIDRFVTFLRAAMRSDRVLVIDAYMAALISGVAMPGLPDVAGHPHLRVFLPKSQKRMIVREQRFDLIEPYRSKRVFLEELQAHPQRYAMMFRASMAQDLDGLELAGGGLIYSLWPGYLDRDRVDLRVWARDKGLDFHIVHSSGHASPADLRRMAEAIAPHRLVPIHTKQPSAYDALYPVVQIATNGVWFEA